MLNSKSIGNKIANSRKNNSLSQAELAQQLAISPQAVGKWERGESLPDITTLHRLAEILGVDLNYFSDTFSSAGQTKEPQENNTAPKDPDPVKSKTRFGLKWNMSAASWVDADFSGLSNLQDKFSASNMKNCKFVNSDLSDLILKANHIQGCDFSNSDLRNSQFRSSSISQNTFNNCSLIDTIYSSTEILKCSFIGAELSGAEFSSVNFEKNNVEEVAWKLVSFKMSSIADITFTGLIEDCAFDNCSYSRVFFRNATIRNTFFKGHKLKGISFDNCETDRMTYEFLKNGKANLEGLTIAQ